MKTRRFFIRNIQAENLLEVFLVSAVAAVLVIRGFLELTGYPELGDDDLHIAHMLWGGLLMLVSIFILTTFLSKRSEVIAIVVGGIGFGTFIDEVGKFITHDNNYFYEPSVAIIYVIFILIILIVRGILTRGYYSQVEYLMNAINDMEEVALYDLDAEEKQRIIEYLDKSDPNNPLVSVLREVVEKTNIVPSPHPGIYRRLQNMLRSFYRTVSLSPWFRLVIVGFFIFQLFVGFSYVVTIVIAEHRQTLEFTDWAALSSSLVSACLVLCGAWVIRKSRLNAYRLFERSVLVSIFFTQVFVFYDEQFGALVGLTVNLLILVALRFMIEREGSMLVEDI